MRDYRCVLQNSMKFIQHYHDGHTKFDFGMNVVVYELHTAVYDTVLNV